MWVHLKLPPDSCQTQMKPVSKCQLNKKFKIGYSSILTTSCPKFLKLKLMLKSYLSEMALAILRPYTGCRKLYYWVSWSQHQLRYRFPKHRTDTVPSFLKVDFSLSSYIYVPWRRAWQSIPVFLPEEPQGQAGYSPQGCKETTEETKYAYTHTHTHTHTHMHTHTYIYLSPFLSLLSFQSWLFSFPENALHLWTLTPMFWALVSSWDNPFSR